MTDAQHVAGASILVTGGAGFVGNNLVRMLLDQGAAHVHVIDNLLSSEPENVPDDARVRFDVASVADDATVETISDDYDYIFHLCTYHGNQSSMHDPLADQEHNQTTTLKLFQRTRSFKRLRKLVYSAAGCAVAEKTYDEAEATSEDAPITLQMDSPYSISKIVGEFYAVYYHGHHGLPTVRARFQNVYGPREVLGAGQWRGTPATVWRNVTPVFIYKALRGEALPLEAGGQSSRDFIYVDDICRGLIACATRGTPGDVYNLASGVETTILELATMINSLSGNAIAPLVLPRRAWDHSGRRFGSTRKAREVLGFQATVGLQEGLRQTVEWTEANLAFIERCMAKHADKLKPEPLAAV